ncbi:MAG: hypothetical protein PUH10_08365, partial [Erysipelotrichaceae bacterium]|uniref:hypothetical protein n=1 Tax=Floccifex sp. TaxID=2815810 RepID=UPI002A74F560
MNGIKVVPRIIRPFEKKGVFFYYEVNTTRYVRGTVPFSVKKDNLLYYNEIGPPAESNSKGGCHMN